jgi:hypothetical protein
MSILTVNLPDSLHKSLHELAQRDGISVDQFIAIAVAEKMAALMTETYLGAALLKRRIPIFLVFTSKTLKKQALRISG